MSYTRLRLFFIAVLIASAQGRAQSNNTFSCTPFRASPLSLLGTTVPTLGTNKLIYFRARFPDDKADPISQTEAANQLDEAAAIFKNMSRGNFQLEWTISPVLQLSNDRASYEGASGFDRFINDVRAAGMAAGFDYRDYDLDIVRHSGVPGFMGGNANLGSRGAQVQVDGAVVIVHELGHNLGLHHANTWVTGIEGISAASPPLPSNFPGVPDPRTIPVYPDSFVGHESLIGPGRSAEYGDSFDIMGSGEVEFSTISRHALGWMSPGAVSIASNGLTLHTIRAGGIGSGTSLLPETVRVGKVVSTPLGEREYWIQFPPFEPQVEPLFPGVQIRWAEPNGTGGRTQLIAPVPGLTNDGWLLAPGRTFFDRPNGVYITLLSLAGEGRERTAEIAVFSGTAASNLPPVIAFAMPELSVLPNELLTLEASASDPDGDPLSWHWNFGDGTISADPLTVTKAWRRAADYVVQLVVSDRKGGEALLQIPVRVGNPGTYRISGRVTAPDGKPVVGARVHNGVVGAASRYRYTFTDSQGYYTLADLPAGTFDVGAFLFGYSVQRRAPVAVTSQDVAGIDFTALELPVISINSPGKVEESDAITNLFVFTRTGPLDEPLTVLFRLGGTASSGRDYVRPLVDRVTFPRGSNSVALPIHLQDDTAAEPEETISVSLNYPSQMERIDEAGNPYLLYFPGYELAYINGVTQWVQTDPAYIPGAGSSVTVTLVDNDEASPATVSVSADFTVAIENPVVESAFFLHRTGNVDLPLTVFLEMSGTAENGTDYVAIPPAVTFAAGEMELTIPVQPLADALVEGEEQITLTLRPDKGYGVEVATATVLLRDSSAVPQTVAATVRPDGQLQLILKGKPASRLVLEITGDFASWTPVRTNLLFNSDMAVVTLPASRSNSFFRTVVQP